MSRPSSPFDTFLIAEASSFRRIAYAAKVETVGDLHGEAWIIASEIGRKRGWPVDFSVVDDQQLIIGRLYVLKVIRRDRHFLGAVQVDQGTESDDGSLRLIDRLAAPLGADPLVQLLDREDEQARAKALTESYSQAAAYLHTFARFRQDRERICDHLWITDATLSKRMVVAAQTYHRQKSLFDRKVKIGSRFIPQPGRRLAESIRTHLVSSQWGWDFDSQPGAGRVLITEPQASSSKGSKICHFV
ncbi:hypothetical protein [Massilia sp. PWRC2]|uniref:hypothetical protein n=1 Tax=Massilia sp. PWRC2 TaxID=2804626 RepID=UPI003CF849E8